MAQALQNSGLLDGTYQVFSGEVEIDGSRMVRATAAANRWLAEEHHALRTGPAVIDKKVMAYHLVAMGNLIRGYASAMGRGYSRVDLRDWRLIVEAIYAVIVNESGTTTDAMTIPARFRREVEVSLERDGLNVGRFFEGSDAEAESRTGDLDILLSYVAAKAAEEFARQETLRAQVRKEKTVVGKVSRMFQNYFFA